jgi:hypothetical protein
MEIVIHKMKKSMIVIIQISILIISIMAFSNIVSAQNSAPLPTDTFSKKILFTSSTTEKNSGAKITGAFFGDAPLIGSIFKWLGQQIAGVTGTLDFTAIISNTFVWAAVVYAVTWILTQIFPGNPNIGFYGYAIGGAIAVGTLVGNAVAYLSSGLGMAAAAPVIGWIAGGIMVILSFIAFTLRVDQRAVVFNSALWQPQTGGSYCDRCNGQQVPCQLYQCKSLGVGCELENEGDNAVCVYNNSGDTEPKITPRVDSLSSPQYSYESLGANGVEIKYQGGDVPNSQSFTFGVELDKVGTCRIADHRTANFSAMQIPFGKGLWENNHTQTMYFPAEDNTTGIQLPNGGTFEYYVRCQAVNGVADVAEFLFKFTVDPTANPAPPQILGFNLLNPTPIKYFDTSDAHETPIKVFMDKPGECSWSHDDKSYDKMENPMNCVTDATLFTTYGGQLAYTCSSTLTGLENGKNNNFYFRCKNIGSGSTSMSSNPLTLIGTRPLVLDSVSPSGGTIKGSSNVIQVTLGAETSAGYKDGLALCQYSSTGDINDYHTFDNTNSHTHSTNLPLGTGSYTYYIQCFDPAGNMDQKNIQFSVETDASPPVVTRISKDSSSLKITTDEQSQCVYDTTSCDYNFADGLKMTDSTDGLTHETDWNTANNYYIKCQDNYGNEPQPRNTCSVVVRPLEL